MYEAGRRERMKQRKPRFAQYELDRMSIRDLKSYLPASQRRSRMFIDKRDLIDYLISQQYVDLISTPPPVEFPSTAVLRSMGVAKLKRTMNETGVFFDAKDVVEKEDMVQIFLNSGRIYLTGQELDNTHESESTNVGCSQATTPNSGDRPIFRSVDTEDNNNKINGYEDKKPAAKSSILVETVNEEDDDDNDENKAYGTRNWKSNRVMEEALLSAENMTRNSSSRPADVEEQQEEDRKPAAVTPPEGTTSDSDGMGDVVMEDAWLDNDSDDNKEQYNLERSEMDTGNSSGNVVEQTSQFQNLSISEMRSVARARGVDLSNCIERSEMEKRLSSVSSNASNTTRSTATATPAMNTPTEETVWQDINNNNNNTNDSVNKDSALSTETLQSWSVFHLRACAGSVGVDLSRCTSNEEMASALFEAAKERPHVATYLAALSPMMGMKTSELRALACDWNVGLGDCLEKGEMVHKLAKASVEQSV